MPGASRSSESRRARPSPALRTRRAVVAARRALGLTLGLAACSSVFAPLRHDLRAARSQWDSESPAAYSFVFRRSCFCGTEFLRAVRITVADGTAVSAVFADDGSPIQTPLPEVPTIPDLFDEIEAAIASRADRMDVTYDQGYGYPVDVSIDFIEQAIDDEMFFQVSEFDVLEPPL